MGETMAEESFFANILVLTMMTVREPPLLFLHLIPLVCYWKAPMR
jgi:hypothetical protein